MIPSMEVIIRRFLPPKLNVMFWPRRFYAVLNMDAGVLGFVVNGKYLGSAFTGLRGKKLHLIISAVWGNCEITMRYHGGFDSEPMPLMELCRHAVRKSIKPEVCKQLFG